MPSQADRILENMTHQVTAIGNNAVQRVADKLESALEERTPKRTGKTARSWTQTKNDDGSITLHTVLPDGTPARYLLELNYGNANQPPTMFIESAIAQAIATIENGGSSF